MATIHRYPFFSHATSSATRALFQGRRGKLVNRGAGASFWFRPLDTSLSEVPVDDMEFGNIFRVTTSDRQEVSVQTALTVRIVDPELTARRVDFEIDQRTGEWTGQPMQNLQNRLAESAKQFAAEVVAGEPLRTVLDDGLRLVRDAIADVLGRLVLQGPGDHDDRRSGHGRGDRLPGGRRRPVDHPPVTRGQERGDHILQPR